MHFDIDPPLDALELRSLLEQIAAFSENARERGRAYARGNRVLSIERAGATLIAIVRGTRRYRTEWEWRGAEGWTAECSCPVGFECKHAYAVAWIVLSAHSSRAGAPRRTPAVRRLEERPERERARAEAAQEQLALGLADWAQRRAVQPTRSLRMVLRLLVRASGTGVGAEVRLTSPRVHDEPRTPYQLDELRRAAWRTPNLLEPQQLLLLDFLVEWRLGSFEEFAPSVPAATLRSLLERFGGSPLVTWAADLPPDVAQSLSLAPGAAVRLAPDPMRLVPVHAARGGEPAVELGLVSADGAERSLDEGLLIPEGDGSNGLVLVDGAFHRLIEQPPFAIVDAFRRVGTLPLRGRTGSSVLQVLADRFPHLRAVLDAHTRALAVTPLLLLDLRDERWLQIRLVAHTGPPAWRPPSPWAPGATHFEYLPDVGWTRLATSEADASSAPPPGDAWLEVPDPKQVEPAIAWLAKLPVRSGDKATPGGHAPDYDDRAIGWWLLASANGMEAFADAWERRPADLAAYGTPRVQRLLDPDLRALPRVRVESSGVDWFSVRAAWEDEALALSDEELAALRTGTSRFVKLRSGWLRREVGDAQEQALRTLANLGVEADGREQRLSLWQLAAAPSESLAALARLGADAATVAGVERLRDAVARFDGVPRVEPDAALRDVLRPYQRAGLDFLAHLSSLGLGAVLADDMGLGKTLQALAWLAHLRALDPDGGPSLVVCPTSVVHGWQREAARFLPALRVVSLVRGAARHVVRRDLAACDLAITSYTLLRRDAEHWRDVELRAAILDEAQFVKNPDAAVTRAVLALRSRHRLVLTGTPLENRALDLWSLMSFANPGYLGARKTFAARYDRNDAPPHGRALLAARLRPVLLRRLKREVAPELPDRIEERRDCELTPGQRKLYLAELRRSRALVEREASGRAEEARQRIAILAALTRLRQICCHPSLAGGPAGLGSGKFEALFELLEPILAEGHKVLVFSQFVECLELVRKELSRRQIAHHVLTGKTTRRDSVVEAFARDPSPCVFLVSLKAGGTGLNLTAASYVILLDPWWNPAVEAQAIDRTHRIGQDRTVVAYRLVAAATVEEKILELQERKAALVRDVLGEASLGRALTRDDLAYLFAEG